MRFTKLDFPEPVPPTIPITFPDGISIDMGSKANFDKSSTYVKQAFLNETSPFAR